MMHLKQRLGYIAIACMVLLSGVVLLIDVRAQALEQAQILFISDRDGNNEIYVIDADGKNLLRLTNNPAMDMYPVWSPDSQRIAFVSSRDGNWEIYAMDIDGRNLRNLTNNPAMDGDPYWFDPAFNVLPAGKLRSTWGKIKAKQ